MLGRIRKGLCGIILIITVFLFGSIPTTFSKFVLEGVGDILNTMISAPLLSVTFINGDEEVKVIEVEYGTIVTINQTDSYGATPPQDDAQFVGWMNANGDTNFTSIKVQRSIILNAKWKIPNYHNLIFIDYEGNIFMQKTFAEGTNTDPLSTSDRNELTDVITRINNEFKDHDIYKDYGILVSVSWDGKYDLQTIKTSTNDIIVKQVTNISYDSAGKIKIEANEDLNNDGFPDSYRVSGVTNTDIDNISVIIPDYILGSPVIEVGNNAFAGFDNMHCILIPKTITTIGSDAFSDASLGMFSSGETITIYFEGSKAEWDLIQKTSGWDDGLSASTRIFFLNGGDKVDSSQGYIQRTKNWIGTSYSWEYHTSLESGFNSEYQQNCNCGISGCDGNIRPDSIYWPAR